MVITQVYVYPKKGEKIKAFAKIIFDGCFLVNGIKIVSGKNGYFVSMPSKKGKNGKFKDIAHPITKELRNQIESMIFNEYERKTGQKLNLRKIEGGLKA